MMLMKYLKKKTMSDIPKVSKTIKEIRKKNCDEDKIFRDLGFLLDL